jgi:two-component system LytT family sensor kinase
MPHRLIKNTALRWLLAFALWTTVGLCFAGQLYLSRAKIGSPVSWNFAVERSLADWYVFALLSIPALWLSSRFRFERGYGRNSAFVHLCGAAAYSLCWMVLRASIERWESALAESPVTFADAFSHALVATFFFNVLIYAVLVGISHTLAYYAKYQDRTLQAAELEKRLVQARLQALQMQLNPHFLFNTLHAISALMHKDLEAADRMIVHLSDLLRYALESTEEQEVSLKQELHFLDRYLQIEQTRFGPRLQVLKSVAPETLLALVPNLILQPLIENAIQHGIEPHSRKGVVEISSQRDGARLLIQVRDNGDGLSPGIPFKEGVGLSNCRARLAQLYPGEHRFDFSNDHGLLVSIAIPWRPSKDSAIFASPSQSLSPNVPAQ